MFYDNCGHKTSSNSSIEPRNKTAKKYPLIESNMSKYCGSCGCENSDDNKYCVQCGLNIDSKQKSSQDTKTLNYAPLSGKKTEKGSVEFHKNRILESGRAMQFLGFLILFLTASLPVNYQTEDIATLRTVFFGIGLPSSMYLIYVGQKILNGEKIRKGYYIGGIAINILFIPGLITILTLIAQIRGYSSFKSVVGSKKSLSFKNSPRLVYKIVLFVLLALGGQVAISTTKLKTLLAVFCLPQCRNTDQQPMNSR